MKPRPYYTVIEKLAGESWKPQYGSYDKEDCRQEVECYASICTNPLHSWNGLLCQADKLRCFQHPSKGNNA